MSTSFRHSLPRCLRVLALLMLALGLLARPLMVVACDIEDARGAIAAGQGVVADSMIRDAAGDCCASTECGECCAPVPLGTPTLARLVAYVPMSPQALPEPSGWFEPVAYPVDSRPPIDA